MTRSELKEKVLDLPLLPGVYIMKDKSHQVIYVGKAKALKNRVSQYFHNDASHTPKTLKMVSHIDDFDIIITETEFEALMLENSLIKKYKPKYNILLKDSKGYPYIKADITKEYPEFSIVAKPGQDKARYFGPYTSRGSAKTAIDTINEAMGLKTCRRVFPRDIGKERPCLNQHLGKCVAPCTGDPGSAAYRELFFQALTMLEGNFEPLAQELEKKMEACSENLEFEKAAMYRDKMRAVCRAGEKQKVVASGFSDLDAIAFVQGETKGCIVVLHYIKGNLLDKEFMLLEGVTQKDEGEVLSGYIKQYYALRGIAPGLILISAPLEDETAIEEYLEAISGRKVELTIPQRGRRREIMALAKKNAAEEILRVETVTERRNRTLALFGEMTGMEAVPKTFEAYDISNTAGDATVGSMVVFENGQPKRSRYRRFRIQTVANGQDDYQATQEMLTRRLQHYKDGDPKFCPLPSAFLMDGGLGHVKIAKKVLDSFGVTTPVFGMVKNDKHRTRALITPEGREIGISAVPSVFALVGTIQEEVHRFAITYHRQLRQKKSRHSTLDDIPGVGEKRRNALLRVFKSVKKIREASVQELAQVVPQNTAEEIYAYYRRREE